MFIKLIFFCAVILIVHCDKHGEVIRLVNGTTDYDGRVEILHDGVWGTVCDDNWSDVNCRVVCRQISYLGGIAKSNAAYGPGDGVIWLDDVKCDGDEATIADCKHSFWNASDCKHSEDAGCVCSQEETVCRPERQRIRPFDGAAPAVGRVEILSRDAQWQSVCDDRWDHYDAAVFCNCLGYDGNSHGQAMWDSRLNTMDPSVPMATDVFHCGAPDLQHNMSIWGCLHGNQNSHCDSRTEAAGVSCDTVPTPNLQTMPKVLLSCDGNKLVTCFNTSNYAMNMDHLRIEPACDDVIQTKTKDTMCYEIPMDRCSSSSLKSDSSYVHYCYDISYDSENAGLKDVKLDNRLWSVTSCCMVYKNGTVSHDFRPMVPEPLSVSTKTDMKFSINCYLNDSFAGQTIEYPVFVQKGQVVYCKVSAATWNDRLYLVVPNCKFMASPSGHQKFNFIKNKCPIVTSLGVMTYNFDAHTWGFEFKVPKFQGYDQLYLVCNSYVCDPALDPKPYCDRSCSSAKAKRSIASQSAQANVQGGPFILIDGDDTRSNTDRPHGVKTSSSSTGTVFDRYSYTAFLLCFCIGMYFYTK